MEQTEDTIATVILQAARCGSEGTAIYSIGPYARRVSFATQQRRALELVWALDRKRKQANKPWLADRVAVVGAGLAGLMATAAFKALGCRVHLFDRSSEPLSHFDQAAHRYIHPTLISWPESALLGSTRFPFMNWYEAQCPEVAASIRNEWVRLSSKVSGDLADEFYNNRKVVEIRQDGKAHGYRLLARPVPVVRRDHPDEPRPEQIEPDAAGEAHSYPAAGRPYDLVVLALGFGLEKCVPNSDARSYWHQDVVGRMRDNQDYTRLIISGPGDGGLADLMHFMLTPPDRIAADELFHSLLTAPGLQEDITRAEEEAFKGLSLPLDYENELDAINAACAKLSDFYRDQVIPDLGRRFRKLFRSRLKPGNQVDLIGRTATPYVPGVWPIWKILLAALERVSDVDGGAEPAPGARVAYHVNEHRDYPKVTKLGDHARLVEIFTGGEVKALTGQAFVSRHGPSEPLRELLKDDVVDNLQKRQSDYLQLDFQLTEAFSRFADDLDLDELQGREKGARQYAEWHKEMAREYARRLFGPEVTVRVGLREREGREAEPVFQIQGEKVNLAKLEDMFGVPTEGANEPMDF